MGSPDPAGLLAFIIVVALVHYFKILDPPKSRRQIEEQSNDHTLPTSPARSVKKLSSRRSTSVVKAE